MDKLDPQVQIRIIDLAEKWTGNVDVGTSGRENAINLTAKYFDQAHKAIIKTLTEK
jgi:hypothetical protein